MKDGLEYIIAIIITVLLVVALFFGEYKTQEKHDEKCWNNGHCDACGGTWNYEQAVGHKYETSYIYVCNSCGKRIEISDMR